MLPSLQHSQVCIPGLKEVTAVSKALLLIDGSAHALTFEASCTLKLHFEACQLDRALNLKSDSQAAMCGEVAAIPQDRCVQIGREHFR